MFYSPPVAYNANPDSVARSPRFVINLRSVVVFREIRKDHQAMNTFPDFMNLSKSISKKKYDRAKEKLLKAYQDICSQSCK